MNHSNIKWLLLGTMLFFTTFGCVKKSEKVVESPVTTEQNPPVVDIRDAAAVKSLPRRPYRSVTPKRVMNPVHYRGAVNAN